MAAAPEALAPRLIELPHLRPSDMTALLTEEVSAWDRRFAWDFRPSADVLRRFLQIRSLSGCALHYENQVIGYSYSVCEGHKGLIGDFYVRTEYMSPAREQMLLSGVVESLMQTPGIRRIESQLMMLRPASSSAQLPYSRYVTQHDRFYMQIGREAIMKLQRRALTLRLGFVTYAERYLEDMAHVVSGSYRGHVDSEINDQYRNIPGARQFLNNIIRFPGCGRFSPESSLLAIDLNTGRLCGICLSSHVAAEAGHVTQLCILPAIRAAGLGYEMLRQTLVRLVQAGCNTVSLTVTCANVEAVRLYESVGFVSHSVFPALVWDGF